MIVKITCVGPLPRCRLQGLHTEHPTLTIGPCRFIGQFQHTIGAQQARCRRNCCYCACLTLILHALCPNARAGTSVVVRAEPNNGRGRGGGAASGAAGTGGSAAASSGDDGFDASAGASESAGATASSSGASAAASSSGGGSAGGHDSGGAAAPATGTHAAPPFVVGMTSRRIVFRLVEGNVDDVCH